MLGQSGQGPISNATGPGRMLAIGGAVALVLGGGYVAWFAPEKPESALSEGMTATAGEAAGPQASVAAATATPTAQDQPRSSYVIDGARLFSADAGDNLNTILTDLDLSAGPQLVVMTVPDLGGALIDDYARRVANQWGIGDPARQDGVLLLIAPKEKQVRIEVGKGLRSRLSDADCRAIIAGTMLPLFRKGELERAAVAGALALNRHLRAAPADAGQIK